MRRPTGGTWLLLAVLAGAAQAAPPRPQDLPPLLRDWTQWALRNDRDADCPFLHGQDTRVCAWPGRLAVSLDDQGGRFTQTFRVYREGWLLLPGDARRWPQDVQVDGRPAVVAPGDGDPGAPGGDRPTVTLQPGEHTVTGAFAWDALPEALDIPAGTGLLSLTLKGRAVTLPNRDASGRVFLQGGNAQQNESERLDLTVHRLVTDEIPLTLTTRLTLQVSGKSREVLLGRALPAGFVAMSLSSDLPVRIEPDGKLRLQVRPGRWTIALTARHDGPVTELARPAPDGTWAPDDEVWVFDARPSLREVLVEGVTSREPSQTTLPGEWKGFPAFAMGEKDVMKLTERRRGDADPAPDELHLRRTLWLDFDGRGYTVSDRISGQLHRSWRLDIQPGTELGRVVAAGADQSITRLESGKAAGVELRQGALALEADSRIVGELSELPAVSWNADFGSVATTLQLPPGWRLIASAGADKVPGTWLEDWTLLDLFLVLVIAAAMGRLFGVRWGALALLALALAWQEDDVPRLAWLAVLVGEALVRVLPEHWVRSAVKLYRLAAWAALAIIAVAFMVGHVRQGMYPALAQERQLGGVQSWSDYSAGNEAQYFRSNSAVAGDARNEPAKKAELEEKEPEENAEEQGSYGGSFGLSRPQQQAVQKPSGKQRSFNVRDYDKNAMVQTGPGLPRWEWRAVSISYSGPINHDQVLRLWLLGPTANLVLAFLRVLLLALLVLCVLGFPGSFWPGWLKPALPAKPEAPKGSADGSTPLTMNGAAQPEGVSRNRVGTSTSLSASGGLPFGVSLSNPHLSTPLERSRRLAGFAVALGVLVALASGRAFAQAAPSPETLLELRNRLLEKPECAPTCASSPRLMLEATQSTLRLRLEVLAGAQTAVPLPGNAQHWVPEAVLLDGKPAVALTRTGDGLLWLAVPEGAHQVLLEGPLPPRDTVQVPLPFKSHRVEAKLEGWTLDGLHEDGLADDNLQLSRKSTNDKGQGAALQVGTLPSFVSVERTLVLGLTWSVETRVTRLTPTGAAVVLEVPLLAGESVTSSDVRVQGGRALVNMPATATEVAWSSVMEARPELTLTAPTGLPWVEVWRLDVSPVWHVALGGIPVVHQQDVSGAKLPEWRPWPGEAVTVKVGRPQGVEGQTLTIDQSSLAVTPGPRSTDVRFTANMRSSRGGLHTLTLPADATLQSVVLNGQKTPIRQEGQKVSIPLVPGSQSVELTWQQASGVTASFRSPRLDVGTATVNADLEVSMPQDRWVLLLSGPRMGPAVLFWSLLLVLLLVSVGLGRVRLTPLKTGHWLLLALGLSQVPIAAIALVVGWLLFLGWRQRQPELSPGWFDLRQVALVGATGVAAIILGASVYEGLLGQPEMQIHGNGSVGTTLRWFQDRTAGELPQAWVLSVPMMVYRLAMLAWSLWMAFAMLRWLKWGWQAFSTGGLWRALPRVPPPPPPVPAKDPKP